MVKVARRPWKPTPRNIEVLSAACALGGRKEAAAHLDISPRVVDQHIRVLLVGSHAVSLSQLCWIYREQIARHVEPE